MAVRYRTRETRAYIEKTERHGNDGVTLHVRYQEKGAKHTTYVTHKVNIDWCNMLSMNDRFHEILANIQKELTRAKERLRGEQ